MLAAGLLRAVLPSLLAEMVSASATVRG